MNEDVQQSQSLALILGSKASSSTFIIYLGITHSFMYLFLMTQTLSQ